MTNTVISSEQVLQQLRWRYATKKFDPSRKISDPLWHTLLESLVLAPSSFGLQPWKFFVVNNQQLKEQLVEHSWGQRQVADASHLLVLAIKLEIGEAEVDHYIQSIAQIRGTSIEQLEGFSKTIKGFLSNPNLDIKQWTSKQVYIALGQFMTTAALLGVDTCPMEGFNPAKYDEILGLTAKGYHSVLVCPTGYRAEDDKNASLAKVRFPLEEMIENI